MIDLTVSQDFANSAASGSSQQSLPANETHATSQGPVALTFHYDAATGSYTVTGLTESQTFAPSDKTPSYRYGQVEYRKAQGSQIDYLRLLDLSSAYTGNHRYVGAGYWQREVASADGATLTTRFDAFTYGLETAATAIPRGGAATYAVDLFARYAPLDVTPRLLTGSGSFAIDFAAGSFQSNVWVYERNIYEDYWTGQHLWSAEGRLGSGNGFSGLFAYQGRYANVSGALSGRFYGPSGEELGAVFNATDANGTLAVGTLVGSKSTNTLANPVSVLPQSFDRLYYTAQKSVLYIQRSATRTLDPAASEFPDLHGMITLAANGDVQLKPFPSSMTGTQPLFTAADRVAAESSVRYTVYHNGTDADSRQLTLFNPGSGNDELSLTYASFGRWDRVLQKPDRTENTNMWFVYGVPTVALSLPRTGSAHYDLILHGSGVTFADAAQYVLTGTGALDLDFAADSFSGSLSPATLQATQLGKGQPLGLPTFMFSGPLANTYAFQAYLQQTPGRADGEIVGRLYGPQGVEFAGSFDFLLRDPGGLPTGEFAGAAVGKKQ